MSCCSPPEPEPELASDPPSPELQAVSARATAAAAVASRIAEVFMRGLRMGIEVSVNGCLERFNT